ncbi:hypothetical protein [Massilia oculi]|uniref:hypothetical protein n=1 Tax=Massilia oculi TaxID=945844 RepID=UPI001AAF042F|nr:hypothetical protein [Massilia oculi]
MSDLTPLLTPLLMSDLTALLVTPLLVTRCSRTETSVDETISGTISCLGPLTTIGGCIWLPVKLLAVSSTVPACGGEGAGLACTLSGETISGEAGIQQES